MNKLAQYLNQHLIGEVTTDPIVLKQHGMDGSPLLYTPQMVAFARSVSDIRKLLRFTWQLAEKGHQLPLTVRGSGTGMGGGSLGSGIVLSVKEHIRTVFEFDPKQHLVRLQPGVMAGSLQASLGLYGDTISSLSGIPADATIGGWLSEEISGRDAVKELEVVLANGDLLHSRRLSKREFNKKKGEQGFEADLYRGVDVLLEDNAAAVEKIASEDALGYGGLAMVKAKDGSFDLTPLFIGTQGTLGVISEMILNTRIAPEGETIVLAAFGSLDSARDALDEIDKIDPSRVELVGRTVIERAIAGGKTHSILTDETAVLLVITLQDSSLRHQGKKAKRLAKICEKYGAQVISGDRDSPDITPVEAMGDVARRANEGKGESVMIASEAFVPLLRFEEFTQAIEELVKKRSVPLLVSGRPLDGRWTVSTQLNLSTVSGKQLVFKLIEDCAKIISDIDGSLIGNVSEGRMATPSVQSRLDPEATALFAELKKLFDPFGTLNPGAKQATTIKDVAKHLSAR